MCSLSQITLTCLAAGAYPYTRHLWALDGARPPAGYSYPAQLRHVRSPLTARLLAWRRALGGHPDGAFARYVLEGIEKGFRIGYDYSTPLRASARNMQSARLHPGVITEYLSAELAEGRVLGPFHPGSVPGLHLNRMGVVPKGHTPGRWRLITDLSHPEGGSVNDGIPAEWCSLKYTSVEAVAAAAQRLGTGALLAKLDIKAAYRLVPVHPDDRRLLGVEWDGSYYVDGALPFGLCSAPKIFTAVADALQWAMLRSGVAAVEHYLDDFITMGPPGSQECRENLDRILAVCAELGVPLALEKLEGPTPRLTFLGIEMDTEAGVLRLPAEKLSRLKGLLAQWSRRRSCRRQQLESLVGTLQHAARVVKPGRTFLRRMIDLLRTPGATKPHHHIRLNREFRADLQWWRTFAVHWNGVAMFPCVITPTSAATSDASGAWGCGAWSGSSWFQLEWPQGAQNHHISFKELFAGLVAAAVWGSRWRGTRVMWLCDNQAAVYAISKRSCRDAGMMHLVRCLFFLEAWHSFELVAAHLPGRENMLADDLSRNRLSAFLSKARFPDPLPTALPQELPELLLDLTGWTSPRWTRRFYSIVTAV